MRSIKFPQMFNTNSTNVWKSDEYNEATTQNGILLLQTERGELFDDPYFGIQLKAYLFDQNNQILKDALIDVIYTQLALFLPQIKVKREDIHIVQSRQNKGKLFCTFKGINQIDFEPNTYSLQLYEESTL